MTQLTLADYLSGKTTSTAAVPEYSVLTYRVGTRFPELAALLAEMNFAHERCGWCGSSNAATTIHDLGSDYGVQNQYRCCSCMGDLFDGPCCEEVGR